MFDHPSALSALLSERTPYAELEYAAPFSKSFLDDKSRRGDPLADRLVAQMAEDNLLGGAWRDLIDVVLEEAKARGGVYQEFVDFSFNVPDWVDFKLMEASQRMLFTRMPNTLFTGLATFFGSAFIPSALSVAASSQFVSQGKPRLIESGTFILKPALGMEPGSIAHYELIRVRVIHSAIRFFMGKKRGSHVGDGLLDDNEYVNQSQMAFFLTGFSFVHLRSATLMGVQLSDHQLRSHHHRWRYMGHVMGIDEDLLTHDLFQERKLALAVMKHQVDPTMTDPFFIDMIRGMMTQLGGRKSERAQKRMLQEFTATLLECVGEDFIGGWGISMSEPGMTEALKRVKLKVAIQDFIQRNPIIEVLQYNIVKSQFVRGRKKLLLAIETTAGEDTLGKVEDTRKERSPTLKRFDRVIERLERGKRSPRSAA